MNKKKLALVAVLLLVAATAQAALFYVVFCDYSDGSWSQYSVYAAGYPDSPPNAPCHGRIYYGPDWCTTKLNCQARALTVPSEPPCFPMPSEPIYP